MVRTRPMWFRALLESSVDVYFRCGLRGGRRQFVYVSPAVQALTGHSPQDFYSRPSLGFQLVAGLDRRVLRQVLRSRRGRIWSTFIVRDGAVIPIELETVALVDNGRVVAVEGVARLAGRRASPEVVPTAPISDGESWHVRLTGLLGQVHDLLRHAGAHAGAPPRSLPRLLRLGTLVADLDQLAVTVDGRAVDLTHREWLVLRYLLERPGRVVTRPQLLADVWSCHYTGDDRTVDVHVSRLRRKIPILRHYLTAIRGIGYRLAERDR